MHVLDPVPQTVENHAAHNRLIGVQSIPGATVIRVMRAVGVEDVIDLVCEASEAERRPLAVPLRGMVVDDIEDHLDARAVKRLDEIAELIDGTEGVLSRTVAGVRSEERHRRIPPVVDQARRTVLLVELEHGKQLHGGDPEIL